MNYSPETLKEMAQQIDLLEYASRSVDFVRHSGNTYYCVCPFHSEKTASLAINTDENYFHCFGCGRSGNIFNWIQLTENLSFPQAVEKVAELTGIEPQEYIQSESVSFLKLMNRLANPPKKNEFNRTILDMEKDYNQRFSDELPKEWIDEGISPEEMRKYEIRIDRGNNRIVYPVYDADFKLIGVKGRTRFSDFKQLGLMKYMNYYSIGGTNFFQGMKQAANDIKKSGEVIIVEGFKSVMKIDGWGYHNVVSAETSTLNEYQIEILIRMMIKDIVIAFDKDVELKKIRECTRLLKRFENVYAVYDKWNLLQEKESPCDQGEDVWQTLYDRRIRL